jgi:heme/copper-type cytochrome/quinol oxidase subunit 4
MSPFLIFLLAVIFSICAFAVVKGGPAERRAGLIFAAGSIGVELIHFTTPREVQGGLLLAMDGFVAGGFLLLALRYASVWLGGAMLLQGIQFSLHAYYFVTGVRRGDTYAMLNNIDSAGVLLCLVVGTIVAWRRRVLAAK